MPWRNFVLRKSKSAETSRKLMRYIVMMLKMPFTIDNFFAKCVNMSFIRYYRLSIVTVVFVDFHTIFMNKLNLSTFLFTALFGLMPLISIIIIVATFSYSNLLCYQKLLTHQY